MLDLLFENLIAAPLKHGRHITGQVCRGISDRGLGQDTHIRRNRAQHGGALCLSSHGNIIAIPVINALGLCNHAFLIDLIIYRDLISVPILIIK